MNLNKTKLIEAYLQGKLSGAEKAAFETQLAQDPLFKSEIELQSDIINSIKTYRKNQLKERLNNIDIPTGSFITSSASKIAGSLVIAGFLGYFGFVYFNNEQPKNLPVQQEIVENRIEMEDEQDLSSTPYQIEDQFVEKSKTESESAKIEEKKELNKVKIAKKESSENVVTPNVIDSFVETSGIVKETGIEKIEEDKILATDKFSNIEISHEDSKNKHLKYKYLNKKLYLYGDFGSSPYELMELNSYLGKQLFLYHDRNYYQLSEDQKSTAPLVPIQDSLVIHELDTLRQRKANQ